MGLNEITEVKGQGVTRIEQLNRTEAAEVLKWFFCTFIKDEAKGRIDLFILITKKSFWSYRVLEDQIIWPAEQGVQVESDRYFLKLTDFSEFDGKRIVIVDDTINTGSSFFCFYRMLKRQCKNAEIIPMVLLMNECLRGWSLVDFDDPIAEQFWRDLKPAYYATPKAIGQMCIHETMTFHDELVSYIVDLPILYKWDSDQSSMRIKMSTSQFNRMCEGNIYWTYHPADYEILPGKTENFGFFTFFSSFLNGKLGDLLLNMVVKTQYLRNLDDGTVTAVFTPFVMLRSGKAEEIERFFQALFQNTSYGNELTRPSEDDVELLQNYYTAVYRSIIYSFSMYIGVKFIRYISDFCGGRFVLQNKGNFTNTFHETIKDLFSDSENYKGFDELAFLSKFILLPEISKLSHSNHFGRLDDYSRRDWFAFLYEKIISIKRDKKGREFISNEELENALIDKFGINELDLTNMYTSILLESLNKSVLNNYVYYDSKSKRIIRGYQYGENTELLLPYDSRLFVQAINTYYERFGKERYYEKLDSFFISLKLFLYERGIFDFFFTERQFLFFVRYFSSLPIGEMETQIKNKVYVLENEYSEEEPLYKQILMMVQEFVQYTDFGNEE